MAINLICTYCISFFGFFFFLIFIITQSVDIYCTIQAEGCKWYVTKRLVDFSIPKRLLVCGILGPLYIICILYIGRYNLLCFVWRLYTVSVQFLVFTHFNNLYYYNILDWSLLLLNYTRGAYKSWYIIYTK